MSLVEIVSHDENIFTALQQPPPDPPKTPRYQSALEKKLKETKIPQLRRTFGYAETPVDPPDKFLRKGQGLSQPIKKSDHKCVSLGLMPAVPKRPPPEKKPERPKVNFRVVNMRKVVKGKARPVQPRLVDTRDGHRKTIKGSGEVPEYSLKPGFGHVPTYLVKRNARIKKIRDSIQYRKDHKESLCRQVADEERAKLLADLKHNWKLMTKAFLQLPTLTDTIPKILKKSKMENELKQLERDIKLVEENPYIYIYDD